jgi:hypothetical protein
MSDIYLSLTETPSVVTLSQPVVASVMVNTVTVANVVSVNVVTMPAINVTAAGGLTNAELRASAVSVAVTTMPALSISSVSISNFPATQTIAGTVDVGNESSIAAAVGAELFNPDGRIDVAVGNSVTIGSLPPISGTVTANLASQAKGPIVEIDSAIPADPKYMAVVGGADLTGNEYRAIRLGSNGEIVVGSLPAISGTVTANDSGALTIVNSSTVTKADVKFTTIAGAYNPTDFASSYVLRPLAASSTGKLLIDASADSGGGSVVGYDGNAFIRVAQSPQSVVTVGSLPAISGTVTVSQLPRVTFIDGSGTVTTANSAITVFASSTTRSYLLVQVTTGSAFVNVGATATTVNGINLTAGQGYAWETTIPQGLVSLISTTTSSRWVAKEA